MNDATQTDMLAADAELHPGTFYWIRANLCSVPSPNGLTVAQFCDGYFEVTGDECTVRTETVDVIGPVLSGNEETVIREALTRALGAHAMDQPDGSIKIGYGSECVRFTFADHRLKLILLERGTSSP